MKNKEYRELIKGMQETIDILKGKKKGKLRITKLKKLMEMDKCQTKKEQ